MLARDAVIKKKVQDLKQRRASQVPDDEIRSRADRIKETYRSK